LAEGAAFCANSGSEIIRAKNARKSKASFTESFTVGSPNEVEFVSETQARRQARRSNWNNAKTK
jgi:hypothetical protein